MTTLLGILLGTVVGGLAVAVILRLQRGQAAAASEREVALADELSAMRRDVIRLSERVGQDSLSVSRRLEGIDHRMTETQTSNSQLATDIFETLGDVRQATTSVADQAREFTALQDLLKAPKARGGIGEAMLEELLRQVLPHHSYECQYRFKSGAIVDVVVKAGGRLVCIDSKFPLSNYRRMCEATDDIERAEAERAFAADVERHIKDISSRYIVPDEDTFDFAVMYVPAEGVYAEILRLSHRKRPLFESAIESRVVPMSPLNMYGYLQTILYGLKCLRIEKSAEAILDFCGRLQRDVKRFAAEYDTLGKHLGNARTKYEDGARSLDRFQDKLDRAIDLADDEEQAGPVLPLEVVND
jgi:DNA recombination protein RmuC